MGMDKSKVDIEELVVVLLKHYFENNSVAFVEVVVFDFAIDLTAHNRNKKDRNLDNNMPMDYFADHTNRKSIEGAP